MREAHGITRPQKDHAGRNDKKCDDNFDVKETSLLKSEDRMPHDQSDRNFTIEGDDDDDNDMHKDVAKTNNFKSSQGPTFKGKNRRVKVTAKVSRVLGGKTVSAKKLNIKRSYHHRLNIGNAFPCKLCGRKFKSLAYVKKHIKQVHSVRKPQINIATTKELNQELEIKTEISVEEPHLQQNESQVLNPGIGKSISQQTNIAIRKEPNQELGIKMEISVEETHLQQNESQDGGGNSILPPTVANCSSPKKCPLCGKNFDKMVSLTRHLNDIHKTRICKTCGISFESKRQLAYHVVCMVDLFY